jgi:hypothetical protein
MNASQQLSNIRRANALNPHRRANWTMSSDKIERLSIQCPTKDSARARDYCRFTGFNVIRETALPSGTTLILAEKPAGDV